MASSKRAAMSEGERVMEIMPLGGLGEIGLNMLLFRCNRQILIVDCGLMFPEEEHLGVDIIIPDFTYLMEHRDEVLGVVLTHGHEDHVGALPYLLDRLEVPLYGTPLTLGLIGEKLKEFGLESKADLRTLREGDLLELGDFRIEPVAVSHSIADGVGLAIDTPAGLFVHSGDFKLDPRPVDGRTTDLERFRAFGDRGVTALLSDSTNAESEGTIPSETSLAPAFRKIIGEAPGRVIVATFSSHLHRLQQVVDAAVEAGRKIHLNGRSMVSTAGVASRLGYLNFPSNVLIDAGQLRSLPPRRTVILTTGSQGEPLSALSRIAVNDHRQIKVQPGDRVVISARVIPGHEKAISRTINNLFQRGAEVFYGPMSKIHVSGHGGREELRQLIEAVRPRFFIPIHGEYRHLAHHGRLAAATSVPEERVLLAQDGDVVHFEGGGGSIRGTVPAGRGLVDGKGYGNIDDAVLKDRRRLANDGILLVILGINKQTGDLVSGPDIIARGVAFEEELRPLLKEARQVVLSVLEEGGVELRTEWSEVQIKVRKALRRFINRKVERRPLILPTIIEV
jgi:ribonuclease J